MGDSSESESDVERTTCQFANKSTKAAVPARNTLNKLSKTELTNRLHHSLTENQALTKKVDSLKVSK